MLLPIRYRFGKLDDGRKISFSNILILKGKMVGVERFELPTSCSQSMQQGKMGILGNCVFATFSKNIKQLTYAGCQSEISLNSSRFRMNWKYCYQSATKFSKVYLTRVLRCILLEWACGVLSDWINHWR